MKHVMENYLLIAVFAPLVASVIGGLGCRVLSKTVVHWVTILGVAISFVFSLYLFNNVVIEGFPTFHFILYTWATSGAFTFNVSFLVDKLTCIMMLTVTFVSLAVHIYSVGYMAEDSSNQRFFSYMSLFTFMMLMLVTANNLFQLFFGWEGVGLVSYLLIGFWFHKESAALGSFKAFIVNRVGDFGFILGLAGILDYFGSLNYQVIFQKAPGLTDSTLSILPGQPWPVISIICVLLFIGAMAKSAQIPLHVWLPESMEGPTPISALIHAATMVTAGVFMVARMSPLFELSQTALTLIMVIGGLTALLTGLMAIVQTDIKWVIAFSTMSQLGYMMAANGASVYSAGIFHLVTHAFFKSLLFLSAGSIIIAMHHQQDLRRMGQLRKYMPITYITFLIGALALAAIPPFSGFYSKDSIIEAVHLSSTAGAEFTYICLLLGAFVTSLYIFRAFFLAFHGQERIDEDLRGKIHEPGTAMVLPNILLAILSLVSGWLLVWPMLYGVNNYLSGSIKALAEHDVLTEMAAHYTGQFNMIAEALTKLPLWFAIGGLVLAWLAYVRFPQLPAEASHRLNWLYRMLVAKLGFDKVYNKIFAEGSRRLATFLYRIADLKILDGLFVLGSGHTVVRISKWGRKLQSGYLYHYAFAMILGLFVFLCWLVLFRG